MGNTHDTQIARIEADFMGTRWRTTEDYRWGYCKDRGPETWWIYYPSASGGNQSPVDILTEDVHINHEFTANPLQICYTTCPIASAASAASTSSSGGPNTSASAAAATAAASASAGSSNATTSGQEKKTLMNNGNTAIVKISESRSYITGGPCKDFSFVLDHIQLHWGENDANGSEHIVNSRPYSAEVHLVHWNEDLYDSYDEAIKRDDGIAIMAVFAKVSETSPNKILQTMSKLIEDVVYRDQSVAITEEFDFKALLPEDTSKYWSYRGSFTAPPCHETVTWIIFAQPIMVTGQILNKFREMRSYCENDVRPDDEYDGQIVKNVRPVQPLGTRKICTPETEVLRRRPKSYDGMIQEQTTVRVSIFPELFDPQRREELFKWLQ